MNISRKTVEAHRLQVTEKLKVSDVGGMIRLALKHGIEIEEESLPH
jgi:DNA-binding CsgD family transcriptional regulator